MKKKDKSKRKRKKAGNLGKSVPENNATDAKWLDTIQERIQEIVAVSGRATAYRAAHPIFLSVPDAWTENEFIENAKQVYRSAHIHNRKRGRRSEEGFAIHNLIKLSHELGLQPTQGAMIKSLMKLNLSKNTAGRYARLYKLYCLSRQDIVRFSQADQQWLCKEFGSESLSPAWWDNKFWQWFEANVSSSGVGEEVRKIFAGEYTETEVRQMCEEMEKLKQERYASDRQQAGFTNAKDVLTKGRAHAPR